MFAAGLTVSLVTTPYLYVHDLSLLLLAILVVLGSPRRPPKSFWSHVLTLCVGILYIPPVYLLLLSHDKLSLLFPVILCLAMAMFCLAKECLQQSERSATAEDKQVVT